MNANAAYLATAERRATARFTSPARNAPARPADLAGLVERWVRHGHESDSIFRGAERAFPPPDPTPAGRRERSIPPPPTARARRRAATDRRDDRADLLGCRDSLGVIPTLHASGQHAHQENATGGATHGASTPFNERLLKNENIAKFVSMTNRL